jgi:hypothetical protein
LFFGRSFIAECYNVWLLRSCSKTMGINHACNCCDNQNDGCDRCDRSPMLAIQHCLFIVLLHVASLLQPIVMDYSFASSMVLTTSKLFLHTSNQSQTTVKM